MGHFVVLGKGAMLERAADLYRREGSTVAFSMDRIPEEHRKNVVVLFESDRVPATLYVVRANECAQQRYGIEPPLEAKGAKGALAIRPAPGGKRDKLLVQAERRNFHRTMLDARHWFA